MGHIWLIGMMGSGKSTVGRVVADRLERPFYDTDVAVEDAAGATIVDVFELCGEDVFRETEKTVLEEIATRPVGVIATGGGIVLDGGNVDIMRSTGTIVLLTAGEETLVRRLEESVDRPLLAEAATLRLRTLARERDERYRAAADLVVDADGSVEVVSDLVEAVCSGL